MSLISRSSLVFVTLLVTLSACNTDVSPARKSPHEKPGAASDVHESTGLARAIGAPFRGFVPQAKRPDLNRQGTPPTGSFFSQPWNAAFRTEQDGALVAIPRDELAQQAHPARLPSRSTRERLATRFAATAAGDLELSVGDNPGAWIHERVAHASKESRVQQSEGRVLYPAAKPGLDRIYEVSAQRVEEYLRIANESTLQQLAYEIEVGPSISEVRVDGSGDGLIAVDSIGKTLLKAPQPTGVDSLGHPVRGKLVAQKTGERRYSLRIELGDLQNVEFPVLLDPSWVTASAMATARGDHTATLLQNGKVLLVGGDVAISPLASVEIYDPSDDSWSAGASLTKARFVHTASLLPNGHVLVVGGFDPSIVSAIASVEIYDPGNNTWSGGPTLTSGRYYHTASTLQNGKVLVVGGAGNGADNTSAELFDPANNTWTSAGDLSTGRESHTATVLQNGKVLVAGGQHSGTALGSVEIYDPTSNSWSTGASMTTSRYRHSATLLPNGKVFSAAGYTGADSLGTTEVYDPSNNTWSAGPASAVLRNFHQATPLLNGKVLLEGGLDGLTYLSNAELYDAGSNSWSSAGALSIARAAHTATRLPNGKVLIAGGANDGGALADAELYAPAADGATCANATDCSSGYCVDTVCCNVACDGGCSVCSVALGASADGVCSPLAAGTVDVCAPLVCLGNLVCPTSCTSDSQCVADHYCAADGTCQPQKPQGSTCSPNPATDCFEANCRECDSGHCTGGFCCDQACKDGCDVCSAIQGASANGVCTMLGAGKAGSPSCAPYVCDGIHQGCPSTCEDAGDCTSNAFCLNGACHGAAQPGAECTSGAECASTHCADGVCCDSVCTGQCEACAEPGHEGECIPVTQLPRGDRVQCAGDVGSDCVGFCDGADTGKCAYPAQGKTCSTASCDGDVLTPAGLCDGAGQCQTQTTENCAPYSCDVSSKACRSSCSNANDCSAGAQCNPSSSRCTLGEATCKDSDTVLEADGTETACSPYHCKAAACAATCATNDDCATGFGCTGGACVKDGATAGPSTSLESKKGCGCRTAGGDGSGSPPAALLGSLAALALITRRLGGHRSNTPDRLARRLRAHCAPRD